MTPDGIALIIYAAVAVIAIGAIGIVREIKGTWDAVLDELPFIVMWPILVVFGVAIAAGWCALWSVRGPIRLVRWLVERRRNHDDRAELPRAEIARRS